MQTKIPAMPELTGLDVKEKEIYSFILDHWPTTPLEIAIEFKEKTKSREEKKRASTKYSYYIKKLLEKKLIITKKAGNSTIIWPIVAEKYRTIHHILKNQEVEHLIAINNERKGGDAFD